MEKNRLTKSLHNVSPTLLKLLKSRKVENLLDVGCGYGALFYALGGNNLLPKTSIGIDQDKNNVQALVNNTRCFGVVGDITKIKFIPIFDLIVCNHVIEHTNNYQAVLDNIYASLAKGGEAFITFITKNRLAPQIYNARKLYERFNDIEPMLSKFAIVKTVKKIYAVPEWRFSGGRFRLPALGFTEIEVICKKI